jgi:amino acid permease
MLSPDDMDADVPSSHPTTPLVHPSSPTAADELSLSSASGVSPPPPAAVSEGEYSPFVAYCVTVNYILGVGVIGMPKAFATGGWLLSTLTLLVVSVMAAFTALWYVETGHRAVRKEKMIALAASDTELEQLGAAASASSSSSSSSSSSASSSPVPQLTDGLQPVSHSGYDSPSKQPRRIEVNELIGIFLSPLMRKVYEVLICVYILGSLWSYTSVFSTGMAANVGVPFINSGQACVVTGDRSSACYGVYLFYCAVFACIVVPIATRQLTEMKVFVVALASLRFVAISCMVVTTIDMLYRFPWQDASSGAVVSTASSAPYYGDTAAWNFSGLGTIFPVCIFAQIFHHSVPGIAYPLRDKTVVPKVFAACLLSMFALYSSLSITLSLYFGSATAAQCTLMWQHYADRFPGSDLTAFTVYLIVLFPPLDVISAFPLKAITVGNNIAISVLPPGQAGVRRRVLPFRLLAAVIPILGAAVFNDLTVLLKYTGSLGIVVAFLFPTWLQWKSRREMPGRSGVLQGWQEKVVDSPWAVWGVAAFCVAGLLTIVVQTAQGG